jgi:hypothetical protein
LAVSVSRKKLADGLHCGPANSFQLEEGRRKREEGRRKKEEGS